MDPPKSRFPRSKSEKLDSLANNSKHSLSFFLLHSWELKPLLSVHLWVYMFLPNAINSSCTLFRWKNMSLERDRVWRSSALRNSLKEKRSRKKQNTKRGTETSKRVSKQLRSRSKAWEGIWAGGEISHQAKCRETGKERLGMCFMHRKVGDKGSLRGISGAKGGWVCLA